MFTAVELALGEAIGTLAVLSMQTEHFYCYLVSGTNLSFMNIINYTGVSLFRWFNYAVGMWV